MNFFSPKTAIIVTLLFIAGGCIGWWLRRYFFQLLERSKLRQIEAPKARVVELEQQLAEASKLIEEHAKRGEAKSGEIAKWAQRYTAARKEIEERINIMDEVENDNIELDGALCKSIVERERLQSLLSQRDEHLNILNVDRMAQESRLLVVKEELEAAKQRIRELEESAAQQTSVSATDASLHKVLPNLAGRSYDDERLQLASRELAGKDRMLQSLRKELHSKNAQLAELQLTLGRCSTLTVEAAPLHKGESAGADHHGLPGTEQATLLSQVTQ